ncbi:zinc finger FYVE domain-containing protein 26, partial [Asbolus verrucosus]
IFNLRDTDIAREVSYAETLLKFKTFLRNNGKLKVSLRKSVEDFFQSNPPHCNKKHEELIGKLSSKFEYVSQFQAKNETFFNLFDLALTETKSREDSETLLRLAQENCNLNTNLSSNFVKFYNKIVDISHNVDNKSISEILTLPYYPLDPNIYKIKQDFYENLSQLYDNFNDQIKNNEPGILSKNHPNHKTLLKINEICNRYLRDIGTERETTEYLARVFNYLKAFSKILYIEQNTSDIIAKGKHSSFFDIFNFNRSELTGKLLFEKQLDPTEFEKYFGKLKLDFLYHVVGNCFPTINLHVQENVTIEELYHDNMLYIPSQSIIVYIQKRNWLLAFILNEMYKVEGVKIDISEVRLQTFFNYMKMPKIRHLKVLFDKNDIIAALQNCISAQKVRLYFQEQIVEQDLVSIDSQNNSNDGLETGQEILEDAKTTNWKSLYDIIESIPENQMKKKSDLIALKNNVLINLVQDGFEPEYYKYAHFIVGRDVRIETIFNNFKKWPGQFTMDIIKCEISRFDCVQDTKLETLRDWLQNIELNEKLKTTFDLRSWYKSYVFCKNYPDSALQKILQTADVDLLLSFIKLYKPEEEILCNIELNYVTKIMELNIPLTKVKDLLDNLPFNHTINICHNLLTILRKLEYLQFIADYLNNNVSDDIFLKNVQVSLKMLSVFTTAEQDQLFCLINEPLSILEVLLMNTKLDKLAAILELLNLKNPHNPHEDVISIEKIDQLLRTYAEKSLDFRVITHANPRLFKTPDSSSEKSDVPSTRSLTQEYWCLNDDPEHNKIIREEFSYEHAPSISLCFSLLKYHSKSVQYPKFLLEQCEVMLKLLQPTQEPTQEIDYLLVIKMLKSLATAAKMLSAEHMLSSGASMADRILSQAELLALLAERGCLNLMPVIGSQTLYVDATVLRRLRDKLLQREQWNLALEVSTKAGLDNTGVFAAWGKSCLKAGSLLLAREKFQRCLDKNSQYETLSTTSRLSDLSKSIDSISVNRSRLSSKISNNSTSSENKPVRDPPLLYEIIQILETKTRTINAKVLEESRSIQISGSVSSLNQLHSYAVQTDTAISILNKIKNLKEISSGNYSLSSEKKITARPKIDPIFYDECVYYLTRYGTYLSLLEFYVKHGDIKTALMYIIENKLTADVFVEIYMKCLKDGVVNILQEQMSRIDSSLDLWKDYLKQVCRHLEKQQLLNCLYQLQLYIGDYVRASMTCIRFYQDKVKTFTELSNNVNYLHKGEEHLKQVLEQEQWVEVTSVGKISNESKDSFEERMLTNPDLVMKIDTKDVNKHINTVKRQIEIVNFLAQCESSGVNTRGLLKNLTLPKDAKGAIEQNLVIPTLFGSNADKINLAVMALISGATVEDGFPVASKIIQDFKLRPIKIYCLAGKQFAEAERYNGITQLVNCIKSTGIDDAGVSDMLDEMLAQAVGTLIKANVSGTKVEDLIKLIKDKATKISAYIEAKQLKTAYFLAVKYKRTADIRRIQREAELLNMPTIKALCLRVLQNSSQTSTPHSKES